MKSKNAIYSVKIIEHSLCSATRGRHLVDYCFLILCCYWSLVELFVFSDHTSVCAFFGQCVRDICKSGSGNG